MLHKHRMALHQIPEIGFHEFKTKQYLYQQIKDYGGVIHEIGATGLLLYFDQEKQETIAFRTDIDALPIYEATNASYSSLHEGYMHACGHDGHMAMLLGLAEYISQHREVMIYNVVLIFQPSEEIAGGAASVIHSGLLDRYQVQAIFGFHLWPGLPKGEIFSRPGPLMAQSSETDVIIRGKAAHIASSDQGIDSLEAAMRFMKNVYDFDRSLPKNLMHLLKFGQITGGTIRNVLANEVIVSGSIRSYSRTTQEDLKAQLARLAEEFQENSDASITFRYNDGYPAVHNDEQLYAAFSDSDLLHELPEPVLQAEDFGVYTEKYPCVFFFLGLGDTPALHEATFDFDMSVLEKGVSWYQRLLYTKGFF
ncbi:amidohydrolase [Enterococcus hirae]|nr:amidohydrolase [Enterococcus hirae]